MVHMLKKPDYNCAFYFKNQIPSNITQSYNVSTSKQATKYYNNEIDLVKKLILKNIVIVQNILF